MNAEQRNSVPLQALCGVQCADGDALRGRHMLRLGATVELGRDALQREGLVAVTREGKYLRCRADAAGLRDLLAFLYTECCTRSSLVPVSALKGVRS